MGLILTTSCMNWTHEDGMDMFRGSMNALADAWDGDKVDVLLKQNSQYKVVKTEENKPGIIEYFFEEKHAKLFRPFNDKCKFILFVDKKTRKIMDWRYNGNPNYCTLNPA